MAESPDPEPTHPGRLRSYWIEFADWPSDIRFKRIPPFPREAGVTAVDERDGLDLVRRGFYEPDKEPPEVRRVHPDVTVARRPRVGPQDLLEEASGVRGIWYPEPFFPDRTVVDPGPSRMPYEVIARWALESNGVIDLTRRSRVVVIERIAYAAGRTDWWLLEGPDHLSLLTRRARPGSSMDFYPESRWVEQEIDAGTRVAILRIIEVNREIFVARRGNGIELIGDFVGGPEDLDFFLAEHPTGTKLIVGRPGPVDDQGVVTVYLPDRDGTTRRHPY